VSSPYSSDSDAGLPSWTHFRIEPAKLMGFKGNPTKHFNWEAEVESNLNSVYLSLITLALAASRGSLHLPRFHLPRYPQLPIRGPPRFSACSPYHPGLACSAHRCRPTPAFPGLRATCATVLTQLRHFSYIPRDSRVKLFSGSVLLPALPGYVP
jgi:hypothetical protein